MQIVRKTGKIKKMEPGKPKNTKKNKIKNEENLKKSEYQEYHENVFIHIKISTGNKKIKI